MGLPILGVPSQYHIWKVVARGTPENADDLMVTKHDLPSVTTLAGPFMKRWEARVAKRELVAVWKLSSSGYKAGMDDDHLEDLRRRLFYGPGSE